MWAAVQIAHQSSRDVRGVSTVSQNNKYENVRRRQTVRSIAE